MEQTVKEDTGTTQQVNTIFIMDTDLINILMGNAHMNMMTEREYPARRILRVLLAHPRPLAVQEQFIQSLRIK